MLTRYINYVLCIFPVKLQQQNKNINKLINDIYKLFFFLSFIKYNFIDI